MTAIVKCASFLALFGLLACWTPATARDFEVGKRPVFDVRLRTPLSSVTSLPGTTVRATAISPVILNHEIVIPMGSTIEGRVVHRSKVGLGLGRERAALEIRFSEVQLADGDRYPLTASVINIDNARESVTRKGQIRGILAADSLPSYVYGVWSWPTSALPTRALMGLTGGAGMTWVNLAPGMLGAAGIMGLRYALVPWPNPEISLPAGTEMRLRVESLGDSMPATPVGESEGVPEELGKELKAAPFRLTKSNAEPAADIINVAFLGTQAQMKDAFQAAGWVVADPWTKRSFRDAFHAFTHVQAYPTAPVSILKYQDKQPDYTFQKSFNTIAKRHHIRVWNGGEIEGQELWLGAATHDIGVSFEAGKIFTHRIDPRLDLERSKLINDLAFAGCLEKAAYLRRPAVVNDIQAAKRIRTDGQLAVLNLQECTTPDATDLEPTLAVPRSNLAYRFTQRTLLETRNYLLRRNAYFQVYQIIARTRPSVRKPGFERKARTLEAVSMGIPMGTTRGSMASFEEDLVLEELNSGLASAAAERDSFESVNDFDLP